MQVKRRAKDNGVNHQPDTGRQEHLGPFGLRDERLFLGTHFANRVPAHTPHRFQQQRDLEQAQQHHEQARWTRFDDFRIAADDDGVGMVPGMAPAPHMGLEHAHEARHLVERIIHPAGLEGGAVNGFMPARVGGGGV
ncbi:hypothetical protein D3C76_1309790 [compost metagenome]